MAIRKEIKLETRQKLLEAAQQEFIKHGLLGMNTLDVTRQAGVAHGTLFYHFETKENLVLQLLDQKLLELTGDLHTLLSKASGLPEMLKLFLDYLEGEEDFFAMLARETPFYPPGLRRTVMGREIAIRAYFNQALKQAIESEQVPAMDPPTVLNFLFGTLNFYLSRREFFVVDGSVVHAQRATLERTFNQFLFK
jgi:AcrR family transcriptional regulator